MALVVFLRGVNVGGHRTFRPSALASALKEFDVVNVGAAGTFVVRRPGSKARFRAELLQKLPFDTNVIFCDGREFAQLETDHPFGAGAAPAGTVRFVTVLSTATTARPPIPFVLPSSGTWLVRVLASRKQYVFGTYRRDMKTIGCLGQVDRMFGVQSTTRNWNTVMTIVRILKGRG